MIGKTARPDAGFTVIEVIAVLAILSIGLAIAVPRIDGMRQDWTLKEAASLIVARLELTRDRAIATSRSQTFAVDPVSRSYWSDTRPEIKHLPAGIAIEDSPGSEPLPIAVEFQPDGRATPWSIGIVGSRLRARISIHWLTGQPHVSFERLSHSR